jgi:cytochrome c
VSDGEAERSRTIDVQVLEPDDEQARFRALVFSKTAGFRHSSIDEGHAALEELGVDHQFQVDHTEDATAFRAGILEHYDTVVFLSTTGDVLSGAQQAAFEDYIRSGGGYAGIHSASDTEYEWNWYGKLVGAYFRNHPQNQTATVHVEDDAHPSTAGLPRSYERFDEWYNFKSPDFATVGDADYTPRDEVHVLARVDESTYDEQDGNGTDDDHPVTWCQRYDGGRSWYTAMGHTEESYTEDRFLEQVLGGLETTAGVALSATCGERTSGPGAPTVQASADPATGGAPLTVRFSVTAIDPDGGPVTYEWRFGDGSGSSQRAPRHDYAEPGTYTATVIATDDEGDQGAAAVEITVTSAVPPTVIATADVTSGPAPLRVRFAATADDPNGRESRLTYAWDFGDGATASGPRPLHRYTEPGVYTATVTATDEEGATGSAEIEITVTGP